MTYEGARATILLEYCGADSCGDCDNCVLGKAIEALEKQIPKKPMAIKIPAKWGEHDYRCPVCATRVFEQSYCMSCGQAIQDGDWSKPKGDSYDFAIIDEVIAYDTQKED